MEKFEQSGYKFLEYFTNTKMTSANLQNPANTNKDKIEEEGRPSIMNRYALFTYKGNSSLYPNGVLVTGANEREDDNLDLGELNAMHVSPGLIEALGAAFSTPQEILPAENPRAVQIVKYFKENDLNSVEYDLLDFLYCKWYGRISNNYMITLRRFPFAVEDNIFRKETCSSPDIARCITYWGKGTDNDLGNILGFSTGFNWKDLTSDVQTLNSQQWGSPFGGPLGSLINATARGSDPDTARQKDNERTKYNGSDNSYLPEQGEGYYHNKILGPVNVIHKMYIRDRGLKFEQDIKLVVEYEMKSYGNIKPKDAMLEILTNLLTLGTNNAPFWGGSIRHRPDNRTSYLIGSKEKLLAGDYMGYVKSATTELSTKLGKIFRGGPEEGVSMGSIIGGLFDVGKSLLSGKISNMFTTSGAVPQYQVVNALLTGEATGEWHLTIGNPLRPIAVIGNLILDDMTITFDETLGSEDFPIGIRAEFKLKPARPRDKSDIENMFNLGEGRMWYKPASAKDIKNNINTTNDTSHTVIDGKSNKSEKERNYGANKDADKTGNNDVLKGRFPHHDDVQIQNSLKFHSVNEVFFGDNKNAK